VKRGLDFWDILMLVGAIAILFWATLKAFGIITSPIWVEMIPYFGAGASLIGAAYKFGKMARGIEETEYKVDRLISLEKRFEKVENEHNLCLAGNLKIKH
jgi:hypothetical protein